MGMQKGRQGRLPRKFARPKRRKEIGGQKEELLQRQEEVRTEVREPSRGPFIVIYRTLYLTALGYLVSPKSQRPAKRRGYCPCFSDAAGRDCRSAVPHAPMCPPASRCSVWLGRTRRGCRSAGCSREHPREEPEAVVS